MILVTGAGGTVGSEVVRQLQATGAPFRAAYHTESKAEAALANGIDAVVIDANRPETLTAALEGADKLFLLSPSAPDQEMNVVDQARRAGVKHIVKLSVWGAPEERFTFARWHRPVEKAIEASGMSWTFLRANSFMQNMNNYSIDTIKSEGAFYASVGDAKISHVDIRDIAAVAMKALTEPGHEGRAYRISGPEALTYDAIAAKLTAASGRPIRYVNVSDADVKNAMLGAGAPEPYADAFADLMRAYRSGEFAVVSDDVRKVTGKDPITFDQYARDYAGAFA